MLEKSTGGQLGHLSLIGSLVVLFNWVLKTSRDGNCTASQFVFLGWVTYFVKFLIQQEFSLLQLMSIASRASAACLLEEFVFLVVLASVFNKLQVDSFFIFTRREKHSSCRDSCTWCAPGPWLPWESLFWSCASLLVRISVLHAVSGAASGALSRGK